MDVDNRWDYHLCKMHKTKNKETKYLLSKLIKKGASIIEAPFLWDNAKLYLLVRRCFIIFPFFNDSLHIGRQWAVEANLLFSGGVYKA